MSRAYHCKALAFFVAGLLLNAPVSSAEVKTGSNGRDVQVASLSWEPVVDQVKPAQMPQRQIRLDGPPAERVAPRDPAYRAEVVDGTVAFEVEGNLPYQRTMIWTGGVEGGASFAYYCFHYRAQGIERSYSPESILAVTGRDGEGKAVSQSLLTVDQVLNDNRWHVVVGKRPIDFAVDALRVQLTTSDTLGRFEIGQVSFHSSPPEIAADLDGEAPRKAGAKEQFECIDISSQCNDSYAASFQRLLDKHAVVVDGGTPRAEAAFPFRIAEGEHNLIRADEDRSGNAEPVELLGTKTTRHYFKPHGRDDLITVPIGRKVSEVFFVMAAELPPSSPCYARPAWPRPVDDIESVAVELQYSDGQRDFAFPYSLADGGFLVRRAVAGYVVSADPEKELARFVLHNRVPGGAFSLGAITVNTSTTRIVPEMFLSNAAIQLPEQTQPPIRTASVRRDGNLLTLSNTYYDLVVDCTQGFSLASLRNRWAETELCLDPSSGLEVELGDTVLTGRAFETESIQIEGTSAAIRLKSLIAHIPLKLNVRLTVNDTPQLIMNLTAENTGASPLEADVRFPVLRDMTIGECDDTWLFFPQYRNVITNRHGSYFAHNDCRFPMQVCDIYNPRAGLGLAVLTHNLDHSSLDYSMAKTDRGVSCFVQSPGELHRIEPAKSVAFTESCLVFHSGDWHEAIRVYREWLDRVSESSVAQEKAWFRRSFLLRNHQMKKFYAWSAPIYDAETKSYCIDDCVETDIDYLGMKPEIAHLFGWADLEKGWHGHPNGDFLTDGYTGGAETLNAAVGKLQDKHGIPTSLYTLSDRCYKKSEFGKEHGERLAIRRKDGSLAQDEANWFLCGNSQDWREQYVEGLCRTQRETGVKVLYVDVFPFSRGSACYSPDHGHEVPSHVNRGTYAMIRQLRESLPDDVVLWSEYPLPDMSLPYIDGNIHYYCLDWHEHFGKLYDQPEEAQPFAATPANIYRYVFPNLKQFIFPCGVAPYSGDTKFPFFNGEALYDCSWSLYASPHLDRIKKSLAIQREHADCFASSQATPEIETLQQQVHANCFPGENRIVWTLFNARYTTVRDPVLAVKHRPGATYYDAWNDVLLDPEIADGEAVLSLTLHPQQLGCVVQAFEQE